ncbi:MAG: hypothetical protein FWD57_07580 [Polyangiaceae bacterium]|nr:hypothetical protein [Polyangiaceae bacterium]
MKYIMLAMLGLVASLFVGCSYGGVAFANQDKVYVTKNVMFWSDKVYICKVTESGLTDCQESPDNP